MLPFPPFTIAFVTTAVGDKTVGSVTVAEAVAVQPFASVVVAL